MYAGHTRRRSHTRLAAAVVILAALSAGWFGRGVVAEHHVAPAVAPPPSADHIEHPWLCDMAGVTCLDRRTFRLAMATPLRWYFPPGFGNTSSVTPSQSVAESWFRHRGNDAGVSVAEAISPAAPDGRPARVDQSPTARAFARWLSTRPFLAASNPVPTTVGGRPAWHVRARLAPGSGPGLERCNSYLCHPVALAGGGGTMIGIWGDMVADYFFVDLPSGTAVVWSWAFGHDTTALARNRTLVDGISWPAH